MEMRHCCGGVWQPCQGWVGRYRCDRCGVFGHRRGINDFAYSRTTTSGTMTREYMVEYACDVKGCGRGGVGKQGKRWFCADHLQER